MNSLSLNLINNNLPYQKGFSKRPYFGDAKIFPAVQEQPITANVVASVQSVQAQYKIKHLNVNRKLSFGESSLKINRIAKLDENSQEDYLLSLSPWEAEIKTKLNDLINNRQIQQCDYDRIINGKSEVSKLLVNNPYCIFGSKFTTYLNDISIKRLPIRTTLEGDIFIYHYTYDGNRKLNKALREGKPLECELETIKKGLENALNKLPNYTGTVHRGRNTLNDVPNIRIGGKPYNPKEFISTSLEMDQAEIFGYNYRFVIKSKNGKYLDKISEFGDAEKEVLFKCDSKYKPLGILTKADNKFDMRDDLTEEQLKWINEQREKVKTAGFDGNIATYYMEEI